MPIHRQLHHDTEPTGLKVMQQVLMRTDPHPSAAGPSSWVRVLPRE